MIRVSAEVAAAQAAYAARPFAVRWVDSHCSGTFRFHTFAEAFGYSQKQWERVQKLAEIEKYRASMLWQSFIETPEGRMPLTYFMLAADVSSY